MRVLLHQIIDRMDAGFAKLRATGTMQESRPAGVSFRDSVHALDELRSRQTLGPDLTVQDLIDAGREDRVTPESERAVSGMEVFGSRFERLYLQGLSERISHLSERINRLERRVDAIR